MAKWVAGSAILFVVMGATPACGGSSDTDTVGSGGVDGGGSGGGGAAGASGGAAGASGGAAGASGGAAGASGGAAGASGGAAGAGASGGTGGSTYTLDTLCPAIAPKLCEAFKPCCNASGFGYDKSKCEANAQGGCEQDVAEAKAGNLTFDPTNVDACLQKLPAIYQKCTLNLADVLAAQPDLALCDSIFEGKVPEGGACQRDQECAPTGKPDTYKSCGRVSKKCEHFSIKKLNESCEIGPGTKNYCGAGLFCDAAFAGPPPYPGLCKTATAPGQPCNAQKFISLECGFGYYCNKSSGVCTTAKVAGAACTQDVECQSFNCQGSICTALTPIVGQTQCTGT